MNPVRYLTREEYTVGWICALPLELAAAIAMLDERHLSLSRDPGDENTYTLGRVKEHNVVIACLPAGLIGTHPAAIVAARMMCSFTRIRFGLMVGIGGGVPSAEHDIRLGDVVVSRPGPQNRGVVQYDFGKTMAEGRFVHIGSMNSPPTLLLTALSALQAEHTWKGNRLSDHLKVMDNPQLQAAFTYQGVEHDQLYEAEYDHVGGATCQNCDTTRLVKRPPRETSDVVVHYGTIASGNQIMRHGVTRDRLARQFGVLCFEMEAAGLVNDFPCVVIRGICDYADSHKNKRWQEYAAVTAAAYAKEILSIVQTERLADASKRDKVAPQGAWSTCITSEEQKCLKSLYFTEMDLRQHDITAECKGTCAWLLRHPKYCSWLEQFPGLLWIKGKPGAGKSTIMKYALRDEMKKQVRNYTVASFFFHGRGISMQRTTLGLFRSLLHQIFTQIPSLLSEFQPIFQKKLKTQGEPEKDWNWHENELKDFFKSSITEKRYRIRIFIDALDECGEDAAEQLVDYFQELTDPTESDLSICFSCRHYPRIGFSTSVEEICVEHQNQEDISTYIRSRLNIAFKQDRDAARILAKEIFNKASGIFQWVTLVVSNALVLKKKGESMETVENMLRETPGALDELYRTILNTIDKKDLPRTLHLMQWACFATRPLSLTELRFAMVSDRPHQSHSELEASKELVKSNEQMANFVRALSGGLVEVKGRHEDESTVQLIHQSVNDFLIQGGLQILDTSTGSPVGQGHHRLSRSCINYSTLEDMYGTAIHMYKMARGGRFRRTLRDTMLRRFPFLEYAMKSWIVHAQRAESENIHQTDLSVRFKWPSTRVLQRWIDTYRLIDRWSDECPDKKASLLHIISRYGLNSAVKELLLEKGADVDSEDTLGQTPLSWAAEMGHEAIVKLLLEKGVDVDSQDIMGRTPLWWAMENRHTATVKLLLEKGANVDSQDIKGRTPLWWAMENRHAAMVKLLLEKGADVDSQDKEGRTPLSWATAREPVAVVKLLLEKGADVNSQDKEGRTPLSWAAARRDAAVVKLLLEKGADADSQDKEGRTPLSWAAARNDEAAVKLLLEEGADMDSQGKLGRTPLWWAAARGHEAVVKLLLEKGANVDSQDTLGQTPLSWAAARGHEAVVKLLLEKGADADSQDKWGRTPLWEAAERGLEAVVSLLLKKGADVNCQDRWGRAPLSWATARGHEAVAKLLFEQGANVDTREEEWTLMRILRMKELRRRYREPRD